MATPLRSTLPAALAAIASALPLGGCERPVARADLAQQLASLSRPNMVLIVVDTLRADYTTAYGFDHDTTPELATWAARGVLFEHALSQSSWTKISVASLLSSLWPSSHGLSEYADGLGEGALILPEVFQQASYETYGVQTNGWLHSSFGFEQGFDRYVFPSGRMGGAPSLPEATLWPHADRVFEETERILDAHPAAEPMFLYIHLMDVHEYGAPPEFRIYGGDERGHYMAAVRWVDDFLSRVREALDDRGLLDRSVLVLASDHGESFGENGGSGHAKHVLTPILEVPLVIRLPFATEGIRVPQQVRNLDIAPTLCELAGIPVPAGFQGSSLVPLMTGAAASDGDRVNRAATGPPLYPGAVIQKSLTDGRWTFARNSGPGDDHREYLFDRGVDPGENVNLIDREPAIAAQLRARLDEDVAAPAEDVRRAEVRIEPSIAERLRAMGYIEQPQ
jgi:arylsulfatase A-like enzyme